MVKFEAYARQHRSAQSIRRCTNSAVLRAHLGSVVRELGKARVREDAVDVVHHAGHRLGPPRRERSSRGGITRAGVDLQVPAAAAGLARIARAWHVAEIGGRGRGRGVVRVRVGAEALVTKRG
jgi:hypothetical protein